MKNNPILHSFGHAALVFLYVSGVVWIMSNFENMIDQGESFWMPVAMLMLFVLSAAICGTLVLGKPILLYIGGAKRAAFEFFGYTLGWLFLIMAAVVIGHFI